MPTPSYVQGGSATRGVAAAETGINISTFTQRFENPKEYLLDQYGGRQGFSTDFDASATYTLAGEITTADSAVMGVAFSTAETLANDVSGYGLTTGDVLLDDIQISLDRGTWRQATLNFTKIEGLTVA